MMTTAAVLEISPTPPSRSLIFTNMMAIIMVITFEDDNIGMKTAMMTKIPGTGKSILE